MSVKDVFITSEWDYAGRPKAQVRVKYDHLLLEAGLHNAYVQAISAGEKGYFASCPKCGCSDFPDRSTQAEAEADATLHRQEWDWRQVMR